MSNNVIWKPQERQAVFMERPEDEALYGGAAGGGKSDALVAEATRQVHIPYYKGLILRKTYPQLEELIEKSRRIYPSAFPGCEYNETKHTWRFPTGAKIKFGSMPHPKNKYDYQGKDYDFIGFDELTHFTYEEYIYMLSRNRPNGPGTRCYIRATANPGGVGHGWVKERFITAARPMTTVWSKVNITYPGGVTKSKWSSRIFVPSSVFDNQILLENDPGYLVKLASLPEAEKKALLYGDWDSYSGQFFTEWKNDPEHYKDRKWTHVIDPFTPPAHWPIYRSYDFGSNKPFSVGWWAVDDDGVLYRIARLYGCTGEPNVGVRWNAEQQFKKIAEMEREHPYLKGKKIHGVADPAIWQEAGGISIYETATKFGIYFKKGDNSRIPGWMQVHNRLQFDKNGYARLYVFNTCKDFIRTFPALTYSSTHVEDVDTECEDHIADETRYMCMMHPVKGLVDSTLAYTIGDDPLNQFKKERFRYGY